MKMLSWDKEVAQQTKMLENICGIKRSLRKMLLQKEAIVEDYKKKSKAF